MTENRDALISASVDGELEGHEHDQAIDHLVGSNESMARLGRYHLIGDAMRGDLPDLVDHGLAARVSGALDAEPTVLKPRARPARKPVLSGPIGGFAIAASVALVAVLGVRSLPVEERSPVVTPEIAAAPVQNRDIVPVTANGNRAIPRDGRLNSYVLDHFEHGTSSSMKGMLPYVIIVSPNAQK